MDKDLIEKLDERFNEIKYLIECLERKIDKLDRQNIRHTQEAK